MDSLLQYAIIFLVALLAAYQIVSVRFALARVERKIAHIAAFLHIDTSTNPPLSERVQELARQPGSKMAAIRRYSADTGLGLVESAAAVEAYLASLNP
jgi:ribosomal protein L7/L12